MSADPGELSEGQKVCLRHVSRGMSSKEIAKATGLAPLTVDTYVKQAMSRLSASNRRDAARMLASYEQSQKSVPPSQSLADDPPTGPDPAQIGGAHRPRWPGLPPIGGGVQSLGRSQKIVGMLQVATVSLVVLIALTLLIAGMLRLTR